MVLPGEVFGGPRVRVVRDSSGRVIGFQDPDQGSRFISRADALDRLRYNIEKAQVEDSFGNGVGVGALSIPGRGVTVGYKNGEAVYTPLEGDPSTFKPDPNQEIIERTIFIDKDGNLVTVEISYGYGNGYDPAKYGGKWRYEASQALGLEEGERLPTSDLQRAVAGQEFTIKTSHF
jgi:hypothetical protein